MKRIFLVLSCSFLFTACASDGGFRPKPQPGGPCGPVSGYTLTAIAYGDSSLVVVPISEIRPDTEWRFKLVPITKAGDPVDYRNANVKILGKPSTSMPPGPNDWIDVSGQKSTSSDGVLIQCVPATLPIGNTYEYLVEVEFVGTLDPRANVIEN